jgi:hypothetical protein
MISIKLLFGTALRPHPTTTKPITIVNSAFIAKKILPHFPDSEKFRESLNPNGISAES